MNIQDSRSIEELAQAIELNPTDASTYHDRGYAYHTEDNYDKAIVDYTKAIQLNPNLAETYNNRGAAHSRKGESKKAIADLDKAIQLKPKLAKAFNNRGAAYGREDNYEKAIADLNKAIQLNPSLVEAYNNRGAVYINNGDYDQALEDLNKAIQLDPNFAVAYYNRGVSYKNKGKYDQANADFAKEKELKNWNVKIENLINQLRILASQPLINQSTFNNFEVVYNQLMSMHQARNLPEQIIQEVNRYHEKMIDRKRFSDLSAKAMSATVATSFLQPQLGKEDIKLVGAWCEPQQNDLDSKSVIKAWGREKLTLGRLLSARSANCWCFFLLFRTAGITETHRIFRRYYNPISGRNKSKKSTGVEKRV